MKFKVGDKVRIRKDLEVGKWYGYAWVIEDMKIHFGKTTTISYCFNYGYELDIDGGEFSWTDEMLEPVVSG